MDKKEQGKVMKVNVNFTNVDSTENLYSYARDKMAGLKKYYDDIQQMDIDIGRTSNHHKKGDVFYCESNIHVPNDMIRVVKETEDLYKAIDKVRDHLKVILKDYSDKKNQVDREKIRDTKSYQEEDLEEDVPGQDAYGEDEYRGRDYEENQA